MVLAGTAGVHSLPDELLVRVFSLILLEGEVQTHYDGVIRSVPLWLLLVCKRWHTLLSGPSDLVASFCVQLHRLKDVTGNSAAMRVLLARLRGTRALKIRDNWNDTRGTLDAMFARLLCILDSLPMLDSLYVDLLRFDLSSGQLLGMRRIARLSSLRSLRLEGLKYRELHLLQGYGALSCLTCLHLGLNVDYVPVPQSIPLPSFVLQLQRLQSLALEVVRYDAGYLLLKVDPVARLLLLLV